MAAKSAAAPMAIEVRAYQVGFGDCFLLTVVYPDTKQHVLIDFGTTELPRKTKPSEYMPKVAQQIAEDCGGALTAVIATHRHQDHISGFGTDGRTGRSGDIIRGLKPRLVIQPWTEDPRAARDATRASADSVRSPKSFIAGLAAMNAIARTVAALTADPPAWMGAKLVKELSFLGLDNIANESAVANLIAMGAAKGATAVWAHHGSACGLDALLPGVKVHVLGPPNLDQAQSIRKQRSRDPDQFWHLLAGAAGRGAAAPLAAAARGKARRGDPQVPAQARWFRDRLQGLTGQQLLQIVRTLDAQMNNTSLILLFEAAGRKLLFPGDAQIENWSYALVDSPQARETRAVLADIDLYKVGHHGSLNATPKKLLWEPLTKRRKGLQTMLSTLPGKHGKAQNDTEVPRRPLLEALENESHLFNTNDLGFSKNEVKFQKAVVEL